MKNYYNTNFQNLGFYIDLTNPIAFKAIKKIIARHLIKKDFISNKALAHRIAGALAEYSLQDFYNKKLAEIQETIIPEYRDHIVNAPAHIY